MLGNVNHIVAHNMKFDAFILRIAYGSWDWRHDMKQTCTMLAAAPILNLPPSPRMVAAGMRGPKTPNLAETALHLLGAAPMKTHDALADARTCLAIYAELQRRRIAAEGEP
jgi:DNA polymerase-3 subunit epsilon